MSSLDTVEIKGASKLKSEIAATHRLGTGGSLMKVLDHTRNADGEGEPDEDEEIIAMDYSKELRTAL